MTRNGWIPIWQDGLGWQFWRDGEFVATVSVGRWNHGIAYIPSLSKRPRRFKRGFHDAVAYIKGALVDAE